MNRAKIINSLIDHHNYKTYLEIGVDKGVNIRAINIANKVGVDPDKDVINHYPKCRVMTSDTFFQNNRTGFDIIFIDGLHHAEQVYKDIKNALLVLNKNGTIVCHDMLPASEAAQVVPREQIEWNGDCWKAWVKLRAQEPNLSMRVIDTDYGCGIIQRGHQALIEYDDLNYQSFVDNKELWMNIISVAEFADEYKPIFNQK